ncbi:MAG: hypothetical protein GY820_10325 [Gammaproteobacteria bacterium]|nr:hypothetical protein [Gammaproteobacteria bacterium]
MQRLLEFLKPFQISLFVLADLPTPQIDAEPGTKRASSQGENFYRFFKKSIDLLINFIFNLDDPLDHQQTKRDRSDSESKNL